MPAPSRTNARRGWFRPRLWGSSKAPPTCAPACPKTTGRAPPVATSGKPTPPPFRPGRTAAAPKPRARPATSSVRLAPCAPGLAVWSAKPTPFPSTRRTTWMPSTSPSRSTTCKSSNQHHCKHYHYQNLKGKPVRFLAPLNAGGSKGLPSRSSPVSQEKETRAREWFCRTVADPPVPPPGCAVEPH